MAKSNSTTYDVFLVLAALFLLAVLGFTIKYFCSRCSRICTFTPICGVQRRVVGIFSYCSPEDYCWITQGLESPMFRGSVERTFPSIISNSNKNRFIQDVEKCDFAILYHTKNRGRINLTNVTDSLYDEEIKYMSSRKGRKNVIVVIDDLEKSGYEEKYCILDSQRDISEYARDLILVSSEDKMHQQGINNKLQLIGDLISDGSINVIKCCDCLVMHHPQQSSMEGLNTPLLP